MTDSILDPPADLRVIVRKYAVASSAPAGQPELSLQAYNTTKLQNGAVAFVYSAGGASSGIDGDRNMYVFDRSADTITTNDASGFAPLKGGGIWRRVPQMSSGYTGLSSVQTDAGGDDTLTAGAAATVVATETFTSNADAQYVVDAAIQINAGAVGGSEVTVNLERNIDGGAWSTIDTYTLTMLADQQTVVALFGEISTSGGNTIGLRVTAAAATQDSSVPADGCTMRTQVFVR
jgi:hypothetical protein